MLPTYEELVILNPRLQRKSREEFGALLETINSCGYIWDNNSKIFMNPTISNSVRTQGLDLFNSESFKEFHADILAELNADPRLYHKLGQVSFYFRKITPKLLFLLILNLALGWDIFSSKIWWLINIGIIIIVISLFSWLEYYSSKKRKVENNKRRSTKL